jgi:phosphatidylserine/phosphatidylglycerophosphate/cardiolipin synthase-like enzyme
MSRPIVVLSIALAIAGSLLPAADLTLRNVPAQVYFSPNGGCEEALVAIIDSARSQVLVQAYSFTSTPLAGALKRARSRGLDVRVILDKSQRTERYSGLTYLVHAGVPVWVDDAHAIAHNKIVLVDGQITGTGSYNLTKSASVSNAENLLILQDRGLTAVYIANWEDHRRHSVAAN